MALVAERNCSHVLGLVAQASDSLQTDPRTAQKHLKRIKQAIPTFLEQLKKRKEELGKKRDELERDEASLQRQIGAAEDSKSTLKRETDELVAKRARNEAALEDAKRDLDKAEDQKREAMRKKDAAIGGTVGGAVGAVLLGIVFPPSLAVTVPAVAVAGTVSITEADKNIDRCKGRISEIERSLDEERRKISAANAKISDIERNVLELNRKLQALYDERGQLRNTTVFMQKAVTYFGDLQVAVQGGHNRTNLLHRMVELANKKERYSILNSKGGTTTVNSFSKAWEQVEDKVMNGDQAGYLGITFVEVPQLQ